MDTSIPGDVQYTAEHLWVKRRADVLRIGVTHVGVEALGLIVFVDVPEPGLHFSSSEPFSWLETAKSVVDLYLPIGGQVVRGNRTLISQPETVNSNPFGAGWLCEIATAVTIENSLFLDSESYAVLVEK